MGDKTSKNEQKEKQVVKYYIDTEFHEYNAPHWFTGEPHRDTIELISIAIVSDGDDGIVREFYAICKEFDVNRAWKSAAVFTAPELPQMIELI